MRNWKERYTFSEDLTDLQKLKEMERKQQNLVKELEAQDAKAQQLDYMTVLTIIIIFFYIRR